METAALDASGSKRKRDNDSNNNSKGSKTDEGEYNNKSTPPALPIATPIRTTTTGHINRQSLTPQELQSGGNTMQTAQRDTTDGGTSQLVTPSHMVPSFPYPVAAGVTHEAYSGLAQLSPGLDFLQRGEQFKRIDSNKLLFQGLLHNLSKYSKTI